MHRVSKQIWALIIVGFLTYFNVLANGFVGDDYSQIVENNVVHSVGNLFSFFTSSTFSAGGGLSGIYYKPITTFFFSVLYSFSSGQAFLFHFLQLAIFIANAVLVYLILKKFIGYEIAFFLSLIFLVHPINAEVAEYIATLQDGLFFFFGAAGLYLLINYESLSSRISTQKTDIAIFGLIILSALSKETGILFIIVSLVYIFLFKRKGNTFMVSKTLFYGIPLILVSYIILHFAVTRLEFVNIYHISREPLAQRLTNIPSISIFYLTTLFFPASIAISYDWVVKSVSFTNFYLPLLVSVVFVLGVAAISLGIYKKDRQDFLPFIFFLSWFVIGMGLHLQIIPLDGTVATRWFYFPMLGILGMIGILVQKLLTKVPKFTIWVALSSVLLTAALAVRTFDRNSNFKDNLTLMEHDTLSSPDNFSLETTYGFLLFQNGQFDQGEAHLRRAVTLAPYYGTSEYALGTLFLQRLERTSSRVYLTEAESHLNQAIIKDPTSASSYQNLALVYTFYESDMGKAKQIVTDDINRFPRNPIYYYYLAVVEYRAGDRTAAIAALDEIGKLNYADSYITGFRDALANNKEIKFNGSKVIF